jgi:hypothetical protein
LQQLLLALAQKQQRQQEHSASTPFFLDLDRLDAVGAREGEGPGESSGVFSSFLSGEKERREER